MSLNKIERRERIKMRIRKIVSGTPSQPRMTVYRSNKQIYVARFPEPPLVPA